MNLILDIEIIKTTEHFVGTTVLGDKTGYKKSVYGIVNASIIAVRTRLELATPCVTGRYSNQLNYRTNFFDCNAKVTNSPDSANRNPVFIPLF